MKGPKPCMENNWILRHVVEIPRRKLAHSMYIVFQWINNRSPEFNSFLGLWISSCDSINGIVYPVKQQPYTWVKDPKVVLYFEELACMGALLVNYLKGSPQKNALRGYNSKLTTS